MALNESRRTTLLSAVRTGTSDWVNVSAFRNLVFFFRTDGNPGAGTCIIEEGDFDPSQSSPPNVTYSAIVTVDIDGAVGTDGQYAYHTASSRAYSFVRARIGTDVTVATLTVTMMANK